MQWVRQINKRGVRKILKHEEATNESQLYRGEMQNIAAVHHKRENPGTEDNKTALLSEFGHFHSDIVRLLRSGRIA